MRRHALWSGLEAGASAFLSILASFAIARIVGPAELGIGAAITAVHIVLWVVTNALFADALVQRPSIDDPTLSSAIGASTLVGGFAMVVQIASGWALASVFADTRLLPMAIALAAPLPLVGAAGAIQGLLTRERAYRRLALRTLIGQGAGTAAGLIAAFAGAGAWALVLQQTVTSLCGAASLLLGRRWTLPRHIDWPIVRSLLAIGLPLTASTLVQIARYRVVAVLIGAFAGPAVLGQVHIAFRLVDTVRDLTFTALWRLMLPEFSRHQHDRQALLTQVDRWLPRCIAVIFPLCALLALGLTQIVALAMGPKWASTGHAALPLLALMAWSGVTFPSGVALIAAGHARFALYANLASLCLAAAGVILFQPNSPHQAIMVWTVSQFLVSPYAMWSSARSLRVQILRPLTGTLLTGTLPTGTR